MHSNVKKWLPRSEPKLAQHSKGIRVVILGDDVSNFTQPDPAESLNLQKAWHTRFLERLAGLYYHTGGVKLEDDRISAKKKKVPAQTDLDDSETGPLPAEPLNMDNDGPAIEVENLSRKSAASIQVLEGLSTTAFDNDPDLVILMYGVNDALQGVSLNTYRLALTKAAQICKTKGVDLIIAGPTLVAGGDERKNMALTRAYSSVAEEVADKAGVLFIDAGSAQAARRIDPEVPRKQEGAEKVLRHVRSQYLHQTGLDPVAANVVSHQSIASEAWKRLSQPPVTEPVSVEATFTLPDKPDGDAVLKLNFKSLGGSVRGLQAIAIGALGVDKIWFPRNDLTPEEISSGLSNADASSNVVDGWSLTIPCRAIKPSGPQMLNRGDLPYGEEPFLRGSLIVCEGETSRIVNYKAPILPLSVAFPVGRIEALSNEVSLPIEVTNASQSPFTGTLEIIWKEKTESSQITIPPGKPTTITAKLAIPKSESPRAFKSQVTLRFKSGQGQYEFHREIELSPDMLLDKRYEFIRRATYLADKPAEPTVDETSVGFLCKAAESGLYLIFDLPPTISNQAKTQPSAIIQLVIDARGPQQRGTIGYCDYLELEVPWQDGRFDVKKLLPGLFGDGYDRALDTRYFLASVTTQRDNRRQVRLSIPRAYFYLHQWSLDGKGQSTLGFNAQVSLLQFPPDHPEGIFPPDRVSSLVSPGMSRFDPMSLGVLNLTARPPSWSARIY